MKVTDATGAPVQGAIVAWSTGGGSVSPATSTTGADGVASARWSLYAPGSGYAPVGTHMARATLGTDQVSFTGHARAGIVARQVTFAPATDNIAGGAASTTVSVHVTEDRRDITPIYVSATLFNPSASTEQFKSVFTQLLLTSGTPRDGIWTGTFTMPAGSETGAWTLGRLTLGWGCGGPNRVELPEPTLASWNVTHLLNVVSVSSAQVPPSALALGPSRAAEAAIAGC